MFDMRMTIDNFDPELAASIRNEANRQEDHVELSASENYISSRVMQALGSVLANKHAEGYPGKRYSSNCEFIDVTERLAIDRTMKLFDAAWANVQPHSGSQANAAVYLSLLRPGDTILKMSFALDGRLAHGERGNFFGKLFRAVHYGVDANGLIDYTEVLRLALEHKPRMIVAGFSAYSRRLDFLCFRQIADQVGALLFVDMAYVAGLVAAGQYPNPLKYADIVTATTHETFRGPHGGLVMGRENADIEGKVASMVFPGTQGGPLMHAIAGKAIAMLEASKPEFIEYQRQVVTNARAMAQVFEKRDYHVVSGGTDNHLLLINLIARRSTGEAASAALERAHITVNKSAVPNDPQSPFISSGILIGTPAITTRGMKQADASQLAEWVCDILDNISDLGINERIRGNVLKLCGRFPVYGTEARYV